MGTGLRFSKPDKKNKMKHLSAVRLPKRIGTVWARMWLIGLMTLGGLSANLPGGKAYASDHKPALEARMSIDEATPFCAGSIGWDEVDWYHIDLLRLAARHSSTPFDIKPVCRDHPTEEGRMEMLRDGSLINLAFFGTNPAREKQLSAIYFPVFLGTTGLRVFVTRSDTREKLRSATTLADLQHFSFGQERRWPDTAILEYNGLRVVDARYRYLHKMLLAGRFDIYPRAYWQAASELDWIHETVPSAVLLDGLALYYPMPIFFFVSPDHTELHDAIFDGLIRAHEAGEVLKLLETHPQTSRSFTEMPIDDLHVINLINPDLSMPSRAALIRFGIAHDLEKPPHPNLAPDLIDQSSQ